MLFTERYLSAIEESRLVIDLPDPVRPKLWSWLEHFDASIGAPRSGGTTTILEAVAYDLKTENGWDTISDLPLEEGVVVRSPLHHLVLAGYEHLVFDIVELAHGYMEPGDQDEFEQKVNKVLRLRRCPWHLSRGEFFMLDRDFVGIRLAETAYEALVANGFVGAANEYAKCRRELGSGAVKNAIVEAGKSIESVLKVLTGQKDATAHQLVKEMLTQSFFDDIPEDARSGFAPQVLLTVSFLRNKLGAHGQGSVITEVPTAYGTLAVQLAAAIHNFLISKHRENQPDREAIQTAAEPLSDDDIPF